MLRGNRRLINSGSPTCCGFSASLVAWSTLVRSERLALVSPASPLLYSSNVTVVQLPHYSPIDCKVWPLSYQVSSRTALPHVLSVLGSEVGSCSGSV